MVLSIALFLAIGVQTLPISTLQHDEVEFAGQGRIMRVVDHSTYVMEASQELIDCLLEVAPTVQAKNLIMQGERTFRLRLAEVSPPDSTVANQDVLSHLKYAMRGAILGRYSSFSCLGFDESGMPVCDLFVRGNDVGAILSDIGLGAKATQAPPAAQSAEPL